MYPDTAHFIYELLQNAEDMHATVARFILSENAIEFEHNGTKRSFNLADVDAITNIGNNAEKRNDVTAIGKFGIGFKAVFAYTDTPEIHSGDYHFKIEDVYVPTKVKNMRTVDPDGIEWTKFILPFNKANKSASEASSEKGKPKSAKKNGEDKLLQAITGATSNSTASKSSLSTYCINLSASITDLKAEPIFGREQEFNEMLSIL